MTKPAKNHPLYHLAMQIRYDLTAAQSKLTELTRQAGILDPTTTDRCDQCGYVVSMNMPSLAEHKHREHGAPRPEAEIALDQRIDKAERTNRREMVEARGWQIDEPELERQLRLHGGDDTEVAEMLALARVSRARVSPPGVPSVPHVGETGDASGGVAR